MHCCPWCAAVACTGAGPAGAAWTPIRRVSTPYMCTPSIHVLQWLVLALDRLARLPARREGSKLGFMYPTSTNPVPCAAVAGAGAGLAGAAAGGQGGLKLRVACPATTDPVLRAAMAGAGAAD